MAEAESLVPDLSVLRAVWEILNDTERSAPTYSESLTISALRDNRQTVYFRDPGNIAYGIVPYYLARGRIHTANNAPDYSLLQAEPDGVSFQAQRFCRHWDNKQPVIVRKNGTLKTLEDDYIVNYQDGRVIFAETVSDWEVVNASFSYYRVYHAARQILMSSLASSGLVRLTLGQDTFQEMLPRDAVFLLDRLIQDMTPNNVPVDKRIY